MKSKNSLLGKIAFVCILFLFGINSVKADTGGFASVSIGGTSVTVSSASDLLDYMSRSAQYTIYVSGSITLSDMNSVASNKAIIGVGTTAEIVGGGLNLSGVDNVVIQNIAFSDWDDDAVNIQSYSTNCWVDHCSFTNGYDGCVDIKRGSDYCTVSWNHFYDHGKTCLLGHSDSNGDQDAGVLRVTYHHNYFDGSDTRHPRVRFSGLTHVYNNYYVDNEYGVASTEDAYVLVEGNYFESVDDPCLVGYASSDDGYLVARNNSYSNSGSAETNGSVPEATSYYSYTLESASNMPSTVPAGAGNNGTQGESSGSSSNNGTINGTYSIIASHSGMALDCYDWGTTDGTNICQWTYWGGECQQFIIEQVDGYWHRITPVIATDQAIDIYGISTDAGANVCTWEYWGGYGQQFRFQSAGSGVWRIINRNSELCLDVVDASTDVGANVQQWTCTSGTTCQMFELDKVSDAGEQLTENVKDVGVYPNPVNNELNIDIPSGMENAIIKVLNSVGQQVLSVDNVNSGVNTIEISDLNSGIYFVNITAGNINITKKVLKN